jgi:acyl-CoA thioester hydrolase
VTHPLLKDFPIILEQVVDWGDMDALGHVNNIVYFRYFENVRVEYLERIGFWQVYQELKIGPILGSVQARFRRAVTFPDTLLVAARITEILEDRFTMEHHIVSTKLNELATLGEGIVVSFDYFEKKKVKIPDSIRVKIEEIEKNRISTKNIEKG